MPLYVLESDHLSLYQRGHGPLGQKLLTVPPAQIAITVISAEELIRGRLAQIRKATKSKERLDAYYWFTKTLEFLRDFTVLSYDPQAEVSFQSLLAQKTRIGTQDLRIAAIVISQEAILITRNRQDFECVSGLAFEDWSIP